MFYLRFIFLIVFGEIFYAFNFRFMDFLKLLLLFYDFSWKLLTFIKGELEIRVVIFSNSFIKLFFLTSTEL